MTPAAIDVSSAPPCSPRVSEVSFNAGEEETAEAWLASEPTAVTLSRKQLQPTLMPYSLLLTLSTASLLVVFVWIADLDWRESLPFVAASALFLVAVLGAMRLLGRNQGPFRAAAHEDDVLVRGEVVAQLHELGVPRVIHDYQCRYEVMGEQELFRGPVVSCDRGSLPPLVLFDRPTNRTIHASVEDLAERLNTVIAEYHRRRATEAWLEQRARELEAPYRKEGEPA